MLLDLPQAVRLRDGDGLALDDGGVVRVCAEPEKLLEIHAHDDGELVRIAWHLGNRHLPVQLLGDRIRIRADHVIEEMVEGLGGHVEAHRGAVRSRGRRLCRRRHHHHHDDDDDDRRHHCARAAAPAGLAVARLPDRRLRLFARPGMGGRSRRHPRRRHAARLADRHAAHGSGRTDAILLRHAHRARTRSGSAASNSPNWPPPLPPSRERLRGNARPGHAPSCARRTCLGRARRCRKHVAYPVAVGALAGWHGIDEDADRRRLPAGLRRQPDLRRRAAGAARPDRRPARAGRAGTRHPRNVADDTRNATLDDLGGCAFRSDLAAMRHETQYTRLFRS